MDRLPKWLKLVFRVLVRILQAVARLIAVLCALITLTLFAASLARQYATIKTSINFKHNESSYEDIINNPPVKIRMLKALLSGIVYYSVSEEMKEIGVEDIYKSKENIYFEFKQKVLSCSQGVVYVQQPDNIPHWIKLTHISGQWYYYRVTW